MRTSIRVSLTIIIMVSVAVFGIGCQTKGDEIAANTLVSDHQITLHMLHWIGTEAGPVVSEINERFHKEYPNITIQVEYAPVDQYQSIIRSRFVAGGAPDILGVFPGTWQEPFAEAGYLMDLSGGSWASRLQDHAKAMMSTGGKLYAMPVNRNAIGVLYDKKYFKEKGLTPPSHWDAFLSLCEQIKQDGRIPMSLGMKDQWVTQVIPYAMAPSAIYRNNPDFDRNMYEGKATFSNSSWREMLEDYIDLRVKGYFNEDILGVTYDQMVQMLATGQTAMMIMGNWSLGPITLTNPDAEIGMFPLPYVKGDNVVWLSSGVSIGLGASSSTVYPDEVRKYIDFWSRPDINALFLERTKSYPVFKDVWPSIDPAQQELEPAFQVGTYPFLDQNWPPAVQDTLFHVIQKLMVDGEGYTIDKALSELDLAYKQNIASMKDVP